MRIGIIDADLLYRKRHRFPNLSRWCNQPAQYSKKSLREFCIGQGEHSSSFRYLTAFETLHPEMAHYLDMKYEEVQYGKIYG